MRLLEKYDKEFLLAIGILLVCLLLLAIVIIIAIIVNNRANSMSANYLNDINDNKTEYKVYVKVLNEYINLRNSTNTDGDPIGKVYKDDIYLVLEIEEVNRDRWYKVQDKNKEVGYLAYIDGKYLDAFFSKNSELSTFELYPKKPIVEEYTTTTTTTGTTGKTKKTKSTTFSKATETTITTTTNLTEN